MHPPSPVHKVHTRPARICSCLSFPAAGWVQAFRVRSEDGIAELHVGRHAPSTLALTLFVVLTKGVYGYDKMECGGMELDRVERGEVGGMASTPTVTARWHSQLRNP